MILSPEEFATFVFLAQYNKFESTLRKKEEH